MEQYSATPLPLEPLFYGQSRSGYFSRDGKESGSRRGFIFGLSLDDPDSW